MKSARFISLLATIGLLLTAASASAAPAPAWKLYASSQPTNFSPGATAATDFTRYELIATNVGSAATTGTITFTATLPDGLTPVSVGSIGKGVCSTSTVARTATCEFPGPVQPGRFVLMEVNVDVDPLLEEDSTVTGETAVSGGGASGAQLSFDTTISSTRSDFDLLPAAAGLGASLTDFDGAPATQAGSHPYQLTVELGFPSWPTGQSELAAADGGVHDAIAYLPPGLIVNPNATPVRCTEVELEGPNCPDAAQIGAVDVPSSVLSFTSLLSPLYNMVPPPGAAASFGFNAAGAAIFVHLIGGVRAGDYALSGAAEDILSRALNPIYGTKIQLWSDPSSVSHDNVRGSCAYNPTLGACPADPGSKPKTPLLTLPTSCTDSLTVEAEADSWGSPDEFHQRSALFTDPAGNPTGVFGCNALEFEPMLQARPTTNAADSPSGLEVDLHIPQNDDYEGTATAHLKEAVVTLPEGLVVNPSGANGLDACSSAQIDLKGGDSPTCPDASKIGTVEVDTPLLDHPLPGAVYVATPHDNPFDSLLAIYVVVDDPQSGVVVKLAGEVEPDQSTGRLTTTFEDNPQLPFEDFELKFFKGAGAALRTPSVCGNYSTTSVLTPWSAPDSGPPATPSDNYAIDQGPNGSSCASSPGEQPNSPAFDAGAVSPIAGAYSPFVVNLKREDGSQQFSSVTLTPPPGLVGKLAGTATCPDSALAVAESKSGKAELASPSCPSASEVGTATVAAGAGPAPYYATGKAYLTGPYKGAPLSMAILTPATAGPYDLGTVVVRTALHIDSKTAQIRAVSDSIPQILQGIPLDVRSASIALDRPQFTLNPTSCDPMSISGQLLSTQGQTASLENRFQLAECGRLGFKPKLSLRLKGGTKRGAHPALTAILQPRPGDANLAAISVALPRSEFLDQAHIGTVCTRVQFAADACPKGAIYGEATVTTPLLDYPLTGHVYLRSSDNQLPDLVPDLRGPASQPIRLESAGRTDSIKGGIRNSFDFVPDAPFSKLVLKLPGGRKGLLINSRNICLRSYRATVQMDAQNGKVHDFNPVVKDSCRGAKGRKSHRRGR